MSQGCGEQIQGSDRMKKNLGEALAEKRNGRHPNKSNYQIDHRKRAELKKRKYIVKRQMRKFLKENHPNVPINGSILSRDIKKYMGMSPYDYACYLHERKECGCFDES